MANEIKIYYPDTIAYQPLNASAVEEIVATGSTSNKTASKGVNVEPPGNSFPPRPIPIPVVAKELIGDSLNTQTRQILSNFSFGKVGAIQVGEYVNGVSGDIRITENGLTARNSAGTTTVSIDGTTGNATFLGTVAAGSVISASVAANLITGTIVNAQIATIEWAKITSVAIVNADIVSLSASKITTGTLDGIAIAIGSANNIFKADSNGIYLGNATYGSAPFRVSMAGDLTATSATITGTITGSTITGSTITGGTVQTSTSGQRIILNGPTNSIDIYNTSAMVGGIYGAVGAVYIYSSGSYDLTLSGGDDVGIVATDAITLGAGGSVVISSGSGTTTVNESLNIGTNLAVVGTSSFGGNVDFNSNALTEVGSISMAGAIDMNGSSITEVNQISGDSGNIDFNESGRVQCSTHFDPDDAGNNNLGGSSRYWNDVSYKSLTDRGCLGWFDDGVELQDGSIVSDIEALKMVKRHATKKTIYGVPMLDYSSLPKAVYKRASDHDGTEFARDLETDEPLEYIEEIFKTIKDGKGKLKKIKVGEKVRKPQDGAETTALISIMFGAIKELDAKIEALKLQDA